ncbi:hypothetical protein P168DRAFT_322995 [Aspergillus campestris IBT 28561]|uniref:NB-ARC domain-containing protein n=1 Tax=Aspergillus campestris (strain IBT 28561) TaxID=1392248 RepID=A0A2I1DD03_ASPC2|nr:uncharacterized protein P168DRAFT_322995 [Aspergillus campestris IBT 28561]PKY07762.1 hypothetical protein P168DRAFT_322995 [Aspergillus campestris IBT 28561]
MYISKLFYPTLFALSANALFDCNDDQHAFDPTRGKFVVHFTSASDSHYNGNEPWIRICLPNDSGSWDNVDPLGIACETLGPKKFSPSQTRLKADLEVGLGDACTDHPRLRRSYLQYKEAFFTKQWESATKSFLERMEPQDRRTIRSFRTYEDVREYVFVEQDEEVSEAALQELAMLQPRMVDLKDFSDFFTSHLHPAPGTDGYDPSWTKLTDSFAAAIEEIEDILVRIERVAAMYQRQYQGDMASWFSYLSLTPRVFRDMAHLPCFVLPPIRTARFFNRDEVIEKIEQYFQDTDATSPLRSLALYGMGGVGKSHVAMKFLEKKLATKDFDAIFWVGAESPVAIQQSFTDIALRLKLPDTAPATHDENRMILKGWLQQTECRWMIIYDNAETTELLRDYWPLSGSKGKVLITTRNHLLGFDPADTGIEILPWDTETGSKFLLHLLAGHIGTDILANEAHLSINTEELLALALIKRDRYSRVYSIHRLIASQFRRFMSPEAHQKAFYEASILMYNAFPKRPKKAGATRANLYNVWDKYLLETQNWRELEDLVTANRIAMATLPDADKEIYLPSSTEIHVASMWAFRGKFNLALESLLIAHNLKLSESPVDLQNLCWIEDNLATIYGCLRDFKTAIQWIERSRDTWKRWSESAGLEFNCPPLLKLTHGRILAHGRNFDEARVQLTEAIDGLLSAEPFVWAPTATCKFVIGRLLMSEGKYDAAEKMLLESQSMWLAGDKSRALDFNGVIVYQLGCCALLQGNKDAALEHLEEAKVISSIHQDTHPAKYARCLFKLSETRRQIPGQEAQADQQLKEAKALYLQIMGKMRPTTTERSKEASFPHPEQLEDEDFDALIHISQR